MAEAVQSAVQVLEFELGEEVYCVTIDYIAEIVDMEAITTVPNCPSHVEGVMDLRGRTTTIVDPKAIFDVDQTGSRRRIVVFDPATLDAERAIGWVVDEVSRVVDVHDESVDRTPVTDEEAVEGIIRRDDSFVVWVDPNAMSA